MTKQTMHLVEFKMFEDERVYTTRVSLIEGYTTKDDIPAIIRVAFTDMSGRVNGRQLENSDIEVVSVVEL